MTTILFTVIPIVASTLTIIDFVWKRFFERNPSSSLNRLVVPLICVVISLASVAIGAYLDSQSIDEKIEGHNKGIVSWGILSPMTYHVTLDTSQFVNFKDTDRLMLIVRSGYNMDIDRMTDTNIEKSNLYTIEGGLQTLTHASESKLRFLLQRPTLVEFDVALVPSGFEKDQVHTLGDVEKLRGQIPITLAQTAEGKKPDQAPPSPVCRALNC